MTLANFKPERKKTPSGDEWEFVNLKLSRRRADGHYKLELGKRDNGAFRTANSSDKIKELLALAIDRMDEYARKS